MSAAENHARMDDMGGAPAWMTAPEAEPPVEAATMMAALVQFSARLDAMDERLAATAEVVAEGLATVLARQRVLEAQLAEFAAMLQEFRPLLEAAQKRLGGRSWRSTFATGGNP